MHYLQELFSLVRAHRGSIIEWDLLAVCIVVVFWAFRDKLRREHLRKSRIYNSRID